MMLSKHSLYECRCGEERSYWFEEEEAVGCVGGLKELEEKEEETGNGGWGEGEGERQEVMQPLGREESKEVKKQWPFSQ